MKNNDLEKEISSLRNKDIKDLKNLWSSYFDTPLKYVNKATLANKIAYRMQELAYGGLSQETRALLEDIAAGAAKPRARRTPVRPVVGTQLIRMHNKSEHSVTVLDKGFAYKGKIYKSLSAIAREITGTNWNGNVFFGLTPPTRKQKEDKK